MIRLGQSSPSLAYISTMDFHISAVLLSESINAFCKCSECFRAQKYSLQRVLSGVIYHSNNEVFLPRARECKDLVFSAYPN